MQLNRRNFVIGTLAAGCGGLASCAQQKPVLTPMGPVDVGTASDYPTDGVISRWAATHGFYLVRDHGRLFAVSSICTHKTCLVKPEHDSDNQFICPCHGSRFSEVGVVLKGPASTSLPHLSIVINPSGRIIVDSAQQFRQDQWDQAGAFVAVPLLDTRRLRSNFSEVASKALHDVG